MRICCYGGSSANVDKVYLDTAFEMGSKLAKNGIGVIYGAGKFGVMGELAKGTMSEDGELIGIVPEFFEADGVIFFESTEYNRPSIESPDIKFILIFSPNEFNINE